MTIIFDTGWHGLVCIRVPRGDAFAVEAMAEFGLEAFECDWWERRGYVSAMTSVARAAAYARHCE